MKNNHYNKSLKEYAKKLRKNSTKSEVILWKELLCKSKMGVRFLRQRPIDNYIADFFCKELKLIIEVDGYSHNFKYDKDIERDQRLYSLGYTVLRIPDEDVFNDILNVEREIRAKIKELTNSPS